MQIRVDRIFHPEDKHPLGKCTILHFPLVSTPANSLAANNINCKVE